MHGLPITLDPALLDSLSVAVLRVNDWLPGMIQLDLYLPNAYGVALTWSPPLPGKDRSSHWCGENTVELGLIHQDTDSGVWILTDDPAALALLAPYSPSGAVIGWSNADTVHGLLAALATLPSRT